MKEPVRSQDPTTETDEERKRRLARERQRRHRAKLRRNSGAAPQTRHAQPHQAQDPVPRQQSAVTSDPRRSLISNPLSSTFQDQSYQQPKPTGGQHIQTHVLQYQRNAPEHEQGVGAVVGSIDAANLGHMRAQAPKRQTRRKAYYTQDNQALRDLNTEAISHGQQQQPQQRSHADVLSVQKQSKSQSFQFQSSPPLARQRTISEPHHQPHNLHRHQQQQASQQFARPQMFRGNQKRHSDGQRDARVLVSGQQGLQEHQTRSPMQQRQSSHSVINHDPSNLSYAVSVLPPEQIPRRNTRDTGADVRRQPRNYSQSDPLQQVNSVQSQRVRQQQQIQDSQAHIQSGSPHRPHSHMGMALHSPSQQQSLFVSQQLPSQSPQPPPLQPQQSRHQSSEGHQQGRVYARLDRRQPDHSFQQRRTTADGEMQVAHLEAGRQVNDLGRSGRKDDYRYGTRQYPDNSIPGFLENNVMSSLPLRTPDRQSILNEQHLQDRSANNRANRSGQAVPSPGQMRKPEMAPHRNQAQHQTAQQHPLDILTSSHHVTGQQFALASQEPSVAGYLQNHQPERQPAAPLGPPPHNPSQSQAIYLQHGQGSTTSQQHTPTMTTNKTSSLVAVAGAAAASNLAAIPTAVNGIHVSAALASGTENTSALGAQRAGLASNQPGYGQGLNFPVVFTQGSVPKDVNVRRTRSAANFIEAVGTTSNGGETSEDRKRRLARDRQRRRRKRIKMATSGKANDGKEEPSTPGNPGNVSMSQGNYSLNSNQNSAAVAAPEAVRIPQVHGDAQVNVGFAQEHLPNEQQSHVVQHVPIAGGTSKQSVGRGSFDGHVLSGSQSRTPNEPPSSGLSTVPQFSGAGASSSPRNRNVGVEVVPANETAAERKRRLARDRQRRRRSKMRKAEQGIGAEAAPVPPANVTVGCSGTRTSSGVVINHVVNSSRADSGRMSRHGGMGPPAFSGRPGGSQPVFGGEQRVTRVNTSERDIASNMNTVQNTQVLPAGSSDVPGGALGLTVGAGSGIGRVGTVANEGLIRWDQVYRTETEARAAVEGAVSAFRRQLESVSETERMFVLQHGIVRLAMLEGLPREKLNGILQAGVKSD